jgi:predicted esterase
MKIRSLLFVLLCGLFAATSGAGPLRTWTSGDGRTLEGELVDYDGTRVKLLVRGNPSIFAKSLLSKDDIAFLDTWLNEKNTRPTGSISNYKLTKRHADTAEGFLHTKFLQDEYMSRWDEGIPRGKKESAKDTFYVYPVTEPSAALYVPKGYNGDPTRKYGIYVHISATDGGGIPGGYQAILDKHNLIGVSAHNSGNKQAVFRRYALALDYVATLKDQYRIDDRRVYVGGLSGGGITAIMLQMGYPDVFKGVVSHARGVNLEKRPADNGGIYLSDFEFAGKSDFSKVAKTGIRFAFVSGDKDFNHQPVKEALPYWEKAGFAVKFFDVPGMGHSNASPEVFDQIVTWIDKK